jgi:hypothetical protein
MNTAIAKQHRYPAGADAHGKRGARQHLALEAGRIDAVAELEGVGGQLLRRWIRVRHSLKVSGGNGF